ncbi:cytochrome c [Halomonas sp. C05BenzN]|uniref:cytochrome c n=1 Tax=Halomonas sp. C05BenzN TaxID=3411041 RepID=UPI003B95A360
MRPISTLAGLLLLPAMALVPGVAEPGTPEAPAFEEARAAVSWRREELKEVERLVRQLRFDLVNNRAAGDAEPRLEALAERARGDHLLPAFIAGSHGHGSEARPRIWEEWEAFAEGFDRLEARIAALREAAAEEDYARAARELSDLGRACKSCHRRYRY